MGALADGLASAFAPFSVLAVIAGVTLGYLVGVLPGLNRPTALAIAIPLTFYIPAVAAIAFLIGISKGSSTGGAVSAILLNTPGEASSAATCLDGYPMARAGRPRSALLVALYASVAGDFLATLLLIAIAAPLAAIAIKISPVDLTAMIILALTAIAGLSGRSLLRGVISAALGIFAACIGTDVESGVPRMTLGFLDLLDGVPLLAIAIGMLALSEMIVQMAAPAASASPGISVTVGGAGDRLTREERRASIGATLRGTVIGSAVGILPGLGASVASFLSYASAQRASATPERFGRGAPEGVAAAEAADNAVVPASLIPLFALGIPGSVSAALLLGAFMIHGVTPGPLMFERHPALVYGVFASMVLASVFLWLIGLFGLRLFASITKLPERVVAPAIALLCVTGAYLEGSGMFGVYLMLLFAGIGIVFRILGLNIVTFLVGFILTPNLELSLRQAIILTDLRADALLEHPFALVLLLAAAVAAWRLGRPAPATKTEKQEVET